MILIRHLWLIIAFQLAVASWKLYGQNDHSDNIGLIEEICADNSLLIPDLKEISATDRTIVSEWLASLDDNVSVSDLTLKAECQLALVLPQQAELTIEQLSKSNYSQLSEIFLRAKLNLVRKDFDIARTILREIIDANPYLYEAYILDSQVAYMQNDLAEAEQILTTAVQLANQFRPVQEPSLRISLEEEELFLWFAEILEIGGNDEMAKATLEEGLRRNSISGKLMDASIDRHEKSGNLEKVRELKLDYCQYNPSIYCD